MRYFILVTIILLCGCSHKDEAAPPASTPDSYVSLGFGSSAEENSPIRSSGIRLAASAVDAPQADYELGNLDKTSSYLFLLMNTGNAAATNVVLTCDNPAVTLVPGVIRILSPTSSGGVQPVVQVIIQHGLSAIGTGTAPTLPDGRLVITLVAISDQGGGDHNHDGHPDNGQLQKNGTNDGNAVTTLGMTVRTTAFDVASGFNAPNGNACTYGNVDGYNNWNTTNGYQQFTQWNVSTPSFWLGSVVNAGWTPPADWITPSETRIANTGTAPIIVCRYFQPAYNAPLIWTLQSTTTTTIQPGGVLLLAADIITIPNDATSYYLHGMCGFSIQTSTVMAPQQMQPDNNGMFYGMVEFQDLLVQNVNG